VAAAFQSLFAETLRLYPPAWIIGRRLLADFEMGGYTIPTRDLSS